MSQASFVAAGDHQATLKISLVVSMTALKVEMSNIQMIDDDELHYELRVRLSLERPLCQHLKGVEWISSMLLADQF